MKSKIITLGDARDERAAADAAMELRWDRAQTKYLRNCLKVCKTNGWTEMAARYEARIERASSKVRS